MEVSLEYRRPRVIATQGQVSLTYAKTVAFGYMSTTKLLDIASALLEGGELERALIRRALNPSTVKTKRFWKSAVKLIVTALGTYQSEDKPTIILLSDAVYALFLLRDSENVPEETLEPFRALVTKL